jgi:hypothetical protein
MNKTLLIVMVVAAALVLGIGAGYAVSRVLPTPAQFIIGDNANTLPYDRSNADAYRSDGSWLPERMGRDSGRMGGRGGMHGGMIPWTSNTNTTGERISMDDALAQAESYAGEISDNLRVSEVMEFSRNFYAILIESDSGRGAMELLIEPYSGAVSPEIGPNMMWNTKYGHMRWQGGEGDNTLNLEEAAAAAQQALDEQLPGAVLEEHGTEFYGYFSFDYSLDGEIAGMLSVNGTDAEVWFHNWHGDFIGEKEIE